jgi:hypothetical protein
MLVAKIYKTVVSVDCTVLCKKLCRSPILMPCLQTIIVLKYQKQASLSSVVLGLTQDGVRTGLFKILSVNSLEQDLSNDAT